jgi:hypothetical protein
MPTEATMDDPQGCHSSVEGHVAMCWIWPDGSR